MKNHLIFTLAGVVFLLLSIGVWGASKSLYDDSYARNRAEIEDLQARYMFALDWQDADTYASVFTEDGVLDWAGGVIEGREKIREEVKGMRAYFARIASVDAPTRPAALRHFSSNLVVHIEGDTATSRASWFEFNNDGRERWPYLGAYGTNEDSFRKVDGRWLFARRKIYNEMMADRPSPSENPAW